MPRVFRQVTQSGHRLLIVDDNNEVLESTRLLLEKEGHDVSVCPDGPGAVEKVREWKPHVIVLDYFMPEMTGEEVVRAVRAFDAEVQILLQTGYASEKPPREMLRKLDIQGYHDKSEGPEKLLIWVDAGLKSYRHIHAINRSRQGLRHILDVVPDMHKFQNLEDLIQGILCQIEGLLGASNSFLAVTQEMMACASPLKGQQEDILSDELTIVAGTGKYKDSPGFDVGDVKLKEAMHACLEDGCVREEQSGTFMPLRLGQKILGVIYFDRKSRLEYDEELMNIFAVQASLALENCRLFGMATEDDLTRTYMRNFFFRRFEHELHEAIRHRYPITLAVVDLDKFKDINDTWGHLVGDLVLKEISNILRSNVRSYDFIGRYGGDEFILAFPHTDRRLAMQIAERLRDKIREHMLPGFDEKLKSTLSIGIAVVEKYSFSSLRPVFRRDMLFRYVEKLVDIADKAMYRAKEGGRDRIEITPDIDLAELIPLEELLDDGDHNGTYSESGME
jgi:diguanylate cyclase (GGDEF)-like protein